MNTEYDVIVLGTGLKECILSGLMSCAKLKVLHIDRNNYYGGESASLNLEDLYKRFRGAEAPPKELGRTRDYCIDLCPKFLMACGDLVKMLLSTKVTRYLEFKSVGGSYVVQGGKPQKVPATPSEALSSSLLGLFAKRRFKNFLQFVQAYKDDDAKTHAGVDLSRTTCAALFAKYSLDAPTQAFTGHAMGLYLDDTYLTQPAKELVDRIKLYVYSLSRYGNSPYIYPVWGLGGLPEGFSRLCAIHGGVYMLNKPVDRILYDEKGMVRGIHSGGEDAFCKRLLADPTYFIGTDKIRTVGQIARSICILSAPIGHTNSDSAQIIIPAAEAGRRSDVYVMMVSYHHKIAAAGKYIAVISAKVEGKHTMGADGKAPDSAKRELAAAYKLLPRVDQEFFWISDYYEPTGDGSRDNCFITASYDASSHFESATAEAVLMYQRLTGHKVDLTIRADPSDLEDKGESDPTPTSSAPSGDEAAALAALDGPDEEPKEGAPAGAGAGAGAGAAAAPKVETKTEAPKAEAPKA